MATIDLARKTIHLVAFITQRLRRGPHQQSMHKDGIWQGRFEVHLVPDSDPIEREVVVKPCATEILDVIVDTALGQSFAPTNPPWHAPRQAVERERRVAPPSAGKIAFKINMRKMPEQRSGRGIPASGCAYY